METVFTSQVILHSNLTWKSDSFILDENRLFLEEKTGTMKQLTDTFYDNKWVKILLYAVSLLGLSSLIHERFATGNWPETSEIVIVLLLSLYVIIDLFVILEKKKQKDIHNQKKIDQIGESD